MHSICVDTKYIIFLIDRQFLNKFKLEYLLKKVDTLILVREINIKK